MKPLEGQVALVLVTIVSWGLWSFLSKLGAPLVGVYAFNLLYFITGTIVVLPLALRQPPLRGSTRRKVLAYPLAAAAVEVTGLLAFLLALERVPLSILAPATTTYTIVAVALAIIILREHPTRIQALGIPLAIAGVIMLSTPPEAFSTTAPLDPISMLLMLLVILCFGTWNFLGKIGTPSSGVYRYTFFFWAFATLFSVPPFLLLSSKMVLNEGVLYAIATGIVTIMGQIAFFTAMQKVRLSLLVPIVSLYSLVPMVLALLFLGESLSVFQVLGAGFALVGVGMASR